MPNSFHCDLPAPTAAHVERIRDFFQQNNTAPKGWSLNYRRSLAHYYNQLIGKDASILEIGCGDGTLLEMLAGNTKAGIDVSSHQIERARQRIPEGTFETVAAELFVPRQSYDVIIISDTLNYAADCQLLLERLQPAAHRETRLLINVYNVLWTPILRGARKAGAISPSPALNWLSGNDVVNFLALSGWEKVREFSKILLPFPGPLAGFINRWFAPLIPPLTLTRFFIARIAARTPMANPSLSIIIPARNEAGNIEAAIRRTPLMAPDQEWIFVEGGSTDNTYKVIQSLPAMFPQLKIKCLRQSKRGKANAVWEGFDAAEGNILMILDADLTMPPEELPKFYEAIVTGKAEMANGVRLVYPMDEQAMQFLNLCANKFFAALFTWLLEQPVKDTLCGTKVVTRADYQRIAAGRKYFGDFDPFGDFDLLFGAARLNLKITDIPIRYKERVYGQTNISRWTHGSILLRMAWVGAARLKFW